MKLNLSKIQKHIPVLLFILAMIIRLILIFQLSQTVYYEKLLVDSSFYDAGTNDFLTTGKMDFFTSATYKLFLAGIYQIFGHNYFFVYIIQGLLGSLSCVFLYFIAKRLFNLKIAIISSILYLLYGPFAFYNVVLLAFTLILFLNLASILSLIKAVQDNKKYYFLLSGILFSLSALTKPFILIALPFILLWLFLKKQTRHTSISFFMVGFILMLIPFSVLRYNFDHELNPLMSSGGLAFYNGNNEKAQGTLTSIFPEGRDPNAFNFYSKLYAEKELEKTLTRSEVSSFWYGKSFDYIKSNPGKYSLLILKKIFLFWNDYEVPNNYDYYFMKKFIPALNLLFVGYAFISSLALLGIFLSYKEWKKFLPYYGIIIAYFASIVIFFSVSRFRAPAAPFLILFSSLAIYSLFRLYKENKKRFMIFFSSTLVLFILLNITLFSNNFAESYQYLGTVHLNNANPDEAIINLEKAVELDPELSVAHYNLGALALMRGDMENAESHLKKAIQIQPDYLKANSALATLYSRTQKYEEAETLFINILGITPYDLDTRNNLGVLYAKQGLNEKAKEQFEIILKLNPTHAQARNNLALLS